MYERARALGEEFRDRGSHVFLGPSPGPMGHSSRAGRGWEGFGADPYLSGVATNASVVGVQSVGVQTATKHYIVNEQERQRVPSLFQNRTTIEAVSSNVDDRTLHALKCFCHVCLQPGQWAIFVQQSGHSWSGILRDELAFREYVMSDWDATHATEYANAGLDMEMPGSTSQTRITYFGDSLLASVANGSVLQIRLDDMAKKVMTAYFKLGQDKIIPAIDPANGASFLNYQYGSQSPLSALYPIVPARDVRRDHAKSIREIGAAGTVLLKNVDGALPLGNGTSIGVFGNDISYPTIGSVYLGSGEGDSLGYEMGTLDIGGGSGTVRHNSFVTPQEAITEKWKARRESGNAIVEVLWGIVEPSGRLPYSIPKFEADSGPPIVDAVDDSSDANAWLADFEEGLVIDYRQFDKNGTTPLYEFGYGLSYTNFSMSETLAVDFLQTSVSPTPDRSQGIAPGGLVDLWNTVLAVTVEMTNSGNRTGFAVPQLYASLPHDTTPPDTPVKVLVGFEKVMLEAGATRNVTFDLMRRDLSFWGVEEREWVVPRGAIGIII
ncbi:Putative glycoside hydrolase, family 3, glycoside hydrolase family 3 domain, immunoglobulin [Septoria linicola]|uniref:Probable beta-glucosidase G n=1 Tax=Septoria linicola TaxID=215465 RepID=A0A9Q9ASV8_9PEZI|nr:Putative glycoside hydrolase, family 3, glycoside hydrolase family 3 domain, immunoglobulin [Septoria linicola]